MGARVSLSPCELSAHSNAPRSHPRRSRRGPHLLTLLVLPFAGADLWEGNLHLLFGAVAVAGLRWSELWVIPILTKVTPGIGLLWFARQGNLRAMAKPLLLTAVLVAVSYAMAPDWWAGWQQALIRSAGVTDPWDLAAAVPLALRLPVAGGLCHLRRPLHNGGSAIV